MREVKASELQIGDRIRLYGDETTSEIIAIGWGSRPADDGNEYVIVSVARVTTVAIYRLPDDLVSVFDPPVPGVA